MVLPPLDSVLASMKFTATTPQREEQEGGRDLGAGARRVVDELPLLSFMQATVLMFPLQAAASTESLDDDGKS